MKKVYVVALTSEEREELLGLLKGGQAQVRKTNRARILLLADEGRTDEEVAEALLTSVSTVERTRKRFVEGGGPTEEEEPTILRYMELREEVRRDLEGVRR